VGPCSSVVDEYGNNYERGVIKEITTQTAALLSLPCYREYFFLYSEQSELKNLTQVKMTPKLGPCVYKGDFVSLFGPFFQVCDDDNHIFEVGQEMEICEKTLGVLNTPLLNLIVTKGKLMEKRFPAGQVAVVNFLR
jgi:hypothetical protein